ncbi:MAG: phage terminase large subunit family protein [Marinobacterium sp.]|nr:phage terminase large subunit family protein [Marinobacterium sp.]
MKRSLARLKPPENIGSLAWGLKYRWMSQEQTKLAGKYSDKQTPWAKYILAALDDPKVRRVVVVKSAQIGWTDGIWNTYLGRLIHTAPCNIFMLFAKQDAYNKFLDKKLNPSIRATPVLRELLDVESARVKGNRAGFKKFPGGSLTLEGANSASNIKSDTINVGCVEEPDDCTSNVSGQGDSVGMLDERLKLDPESKLVFGGTPTIKGLSRVENEYQLTDRRTFPVPCHECGEYHVLDWANVCWEEDPALSDEVYGHARIDTAAYACPHCGCLWDDWQKARNVENLIEHIERPEITEDVGFFINELYSLFDGSDLATLVKKYLKAQYELERGDEAKMIVFVNNTLAQGYEFKSDNATADDLREKALDYPELQVPRNGVVLTMGVDVQRDRLAVTIWAWGKGMEAWLVYWGELYAHHDINDVKDPVWAALDRLLLGGYRHESGAVLRITACSLDTGDGVTQGATYSYVRERRKRGVKLLAIKGANSLEAPIKARPKPLDLNARSKASRFGLEVWPVGTQATKDLIAGRLKLEGDGPGRMHTYTDVRPDFYDQMTGEIKAPSRTHRNKKIWQQRSGAAVEAWDCTVYATHAAYVENLHLRKDDWWDVKAADVSQIDLLANNEEIEIITSVGDRPGIDVDDEREVEAVTPEPTPEPVKASTLTITPRPRQTTPPAPDTPQRSMADLGRMMRGG